MASLAAAMGSAAVAFLGGYSGALAMGVAGGGQPTAVRRRGARVHGRRVSHPLLKREVAQSVAVHVIVQAVEMGLLERGKCGINELQGRLPQELWGGFRTSKTWDDAAALLYAKSMGSDGGIVDPLDPRYAFIAFDPSLATAGPGAIDPPQHGDFGPPAMVRAKWVAMCKKAGNISKLQWEHSTRNGYDITAQIALRDVPRELLADPNVMMVAALKDAEALYYASDELRQNSDIVMAAIGQNAYDGLRFSQMHDNSDIVMSAVEQNGLALEHASERVQGMPEVVMAAVQQNGTALEHASVWLRGEQGVVIAAVQQNGTALEHASERLQDDRGVVIAAVAHDGKALEYASKRLQDDSTILTDASEAYGYSPTSPSYSPASPSYSPGSPISEFEELAEAESGSDLEEAPAGLVLTPELEELAAELEAEFGQSPIS